MDNPTGHDILKHFKVIKDVVLSYEEILNRKKDPSVYHEEERTRLRTKFANALALFQTAQNDHQRMIQEDKMVELGGQIRDEDQRWRNNCVADNRDWEASLSATMDELRSTLAPLLYLPNPLQNQNTTGVEAGTTQMEQRIPDSQTGTQTEQRTHDSEIETRTEENENEIDTTEETVAGNESNAPHPDQHEITMDEPVERNSPDNLVPEPSPLAEIEVEQGPTFDDEEDDMEVNVADHDTNHSAEAVIVNRGDTTNSGEDLDETTRDAPAENDHESSSSENSDSDESTGSSDSDDEPLVRHPPSRQRVSSRATGGSIEVLQTPVRQTRTCMARVSSSRATRSSKQKEPLRNKRRASNASPPPTRSKRLRGGAEVTKKTDESPLQVQPTPRESSKPVESPAGGPSRNITRELSQKRGNKSIEPSTRAPRRRSQRYMVESGENGEFEGVLKPIPGKVYATYSKKLKAYLAVIALPMGEFSSIGFGGSIDSCALPENPCYTKNRKGEYIWAKGYRDGEELEKERMFPILYFDGNPFPHQSAIGWCAGKYLREFGDEHKSVSYMKTVRQYLQSRGCTEDAQDSEADRARTGSATQADSEAEPVRSESVAREIQVAEHDDNYVPPIDLDTEGEDFDVTEVAEEDIDMADGTAEEPMNRRQRNEQRRADRREKDRPANETPEPKRPAEPAEIRASESFGEPPRPSSPNVRLATSPSHEPLTEASALDEPLVGEHVNCTHINEHVRDVPRTEQRGTRSSIKEEEEITVILSDSEDEDDAVPASNAEHHSTERGSLSHVFPFETSDRASYPPIGTFRHTSMAASPRQSVPPAQAQQQPSQGRLQGLRSQVHQLLNDPQPSQDGQSETVPSPQAQRQISNRRPGPPTSAVSSRRDSSRIRVHDIISPDSSAEASGSAQYAPRERSPSMLQKTAVQAVEELGERRQSKACEECRRKKARCDPSHWLRGPIFRSETATLASSQPAAHSSQRPLTPSTSPFVNPNHDHQLPRGTWNTPTSNPPGNSADDELFGAWLHRRRTSQSTQNQTQTPSPNSQLQEPSTSTVAPSQAGPSRAQNDQGRSNEDVYSMSNRDEDLPDPETLDEFIYEQRGHLPPHHLCFHKIIPLARPREFPPLKNSKKCPPGLSRYLMKLAQTKGLVKEAGLAVVKYFELLDEKGYSGGHFCPFCKARSCHRIDNYSRPSFVPHLLTHWKKAGEARIEMPNV